MSKKFWQWWEISTMAKFFLTISNYLCSSAWYFLAFLTSQDPGIQILVKIPGNPGIFRDPWQCIPGWREIWAIFMNFPGNSGNFHYFPGKFREFSWIFREILGIFMNFPGNSGNFNEFPGKFRDWICSWPGSLIWQVEKKGFVFESCVDFLRQNNQNNPEKKHSLFCPLLLYKIVTAFEWPSDLLLKVWEVQHPPGDSINQR